MQLLNDLKLKYQHGNVAIKLIFWNIGIFLFTVVFLRISPNAFAFFADCTFLDSNANIAFTRPWTLLSYSFLHALNDWFHLAFNLLVLYFVSSIFFTFFREKDFLVFYFFGAIVGGLFFLLASYLFDYNSTLIGASAAVYSVLFAVAAYRPKMPLKFAFVNLTIPLDYFVFALLGIDLLMILVGNDNLGGRISHVGGAAFGWFYMKQFERGNDFLGTFLGQIQQAFVAKPKSKSKPKRKAAQTKGRQSQSKTADYQGYNKSKEQQKIDLILEKISASGYDSLSKKEKDILFKASGKN